MALTLSGCAGLHVRPIEDYARTEPAGTLRVAFDQDGDIYPRDESQVPWASVKMNPLSEAFGRNSFSLRKIEVGGTTPYSEALREALRQDAVRRLNAMLTPGGKLLVVVHGFNEAHLEARANFDTFRQAVGSANLPPTLEVYWDGLVIPNDHFGQFARATFWPNALLYSNLAGQHGLRRMLNGIATATDVRVLTFSRGAAVALSAIADPEYDDVFSKEPVIAFANPNISSLKVGMVAAAVGAGHVRGEANTQVGAQFGRPVPLIVGLNEKDFAVSKLGRPGAYCDTRLGADVEYTREIVEKRWTFLPTEAVVFSHGSSHGLTAYAFANRQSGALTGAMSCLLWKLDLRPGDCSGVTVYR
jgi:hypothetical protein